MRKSAHQLTNLCSTLALDILVPTNVLLSHPDLCS